jgi:hypothetical protein
VEVYQTRLFAKECADPVCDIVNREGSDSPHWTDFALYLTVQVLEIMNRRQLIPYRLEALLGFLEHSF